jgi:peptidoglycan/LPS O-acetylase OafA/YrhL
VPTDPLSNSGSAWRTPASSSNIIILDALRGAGALIVVADHLRHALFVEHHSLDAHKAIFAIPYLVTVSGREAVLLFFALSGYLVGGSALRSFKSHTWTWRRYLSARLVRLWLVLLPALLLVLLVDSSNIALQNHFPSYGGKVMRALISPASSHSLSGSVFFANLTFLQKIPFPAFFGLAEIPPLGTDGALWSLTNEFWYYILFPLGFLVVRGYYKPMQRLIVAAAFLLISLILGKTIFLMFIFWIGGALLSILPRWDFARLFKLSATGIYIVADLYCASLLQTHEQRADYIFWGITLAYMWIVIPATVKHGPATPWSRIAERSASFSYTLYLVHMPMMYLLSGFFIHDERWQPSIKHLAGALGIYVVLIVYAWNLARLTEFRYKPIRIWVDMRLDAVFEQSFPGWTRNLRRHQYPNPVFDDHPPLIAPHPDTLNVE